MIDAVIRDGKCEKIHVPTEDYLKEYDEVLTIKTSIGEVPVYKFIEKFLKIQDKDGNILSFELKKAQADLYKEMCEMKLAGKPIRINILKARQLGFSTFIAAIIFTLVIFVPNQKAAIVADLAEHATNLFDKYKFFYDNLPKELKLPLEKSNAKELVVSYGNGIKSSIRITVQGEGAGRSGTYQYLHLSECAFWADLKKTLVSLLQTVSKSNINSMIFLETTGNGFNEYKSRWDKDVIGKSEYKAMFFGWYCDPEYQLPYRGFKLLLWEEELKEKYNLTLEQIAWYHSQYLDFDEDDGDLKQEYPSSPIEAFKTTGSSVFKTELIQKRKEEILLGIPQKVGIFTYKAEYSRDGSKISVTERKFFEHKKGDITIFKEVEDGHPYVANLDPAMGGEDSFAIQVLNNYTGEQVAVYHQNKADDDFVAFQLMCLGWYYNTALLSAECNNPNGSYILQLCEKAGYKNIYQDKDFEEISDRYANKFGYKTKQNNKNVMVSLFKLAFRNNYRFINDYETLCEMEAFQVTKSEKGKKEQYAASSDAHDDLVTAMCGVFLIRDEQDCIPSEKHMTKRKPWDPFSYMNDDKEQRKEVFQVWD